MISATELKGIIVPIVTPVNEDGTVDYSGLDNVVQHVIAGGVHGIFALGGTGNFCSFNFQERFGIAQAVVQAVHGRLPVLVGCMDSNTRLVLQNVKLAADAGADGVVVEAPYYYLCTDEDALVHFEAVNAHSEIPIVVYHNPLETKVRHSLSFMQKLSEMPKIIGVKDSSNDFVLFQQMLTAFAALPFCVLQGQEPLAGASFLFGAPGAMLAMGNVVPRLCVRLFEAGTAGKLGTTQELQAQLVQAAQMLREDGYETSEESTHSFFAGLQASMVALGVCRRIVIPPHRLPTPVHYKNTEMILDALNK